MTRIYRIAAHFGPAPVHGGQSPVIVANPEHAPRRLSARPCNYAKMDGPPPDLVLAAHLAGTIVAVGMILGFTAIVAFSLKYLA
jgi:hypothetical protein